MKKYLTKGMQGVFKAAQNTVFFGKGKNNTPANDQNREESKAIDQPPTSSESVKIEEAKKPEEKKWAKGVILVNTYVPPAEKTIADFHEEVEERVKELKLVGQFYFLL